MARGIRIVGAGAKPEVEPDLPPGPASPRKPRAPAAGAAKMWSGRLGAGTARRVEEFTTSVAVDRRLFADDITASVAHLHMLRRVGLVTAADARSLETALRAVRREFDRGEFAFDQGDEDIHSAIERRLFELAGDVAGRLHTGRSRNDQVVTDLRMYAKRAGCELMLGVASLQEAVIARSHEHAATLLPGYTHGQRAQVISLGHHLLAYVEMLQRDVSRLHDARDRCDVLPLGSGALAGSTLPLDRRSVAAELGFAAISANSVDAVSDRDFAVDFTAACAVIMVHLSRLAEEVVRWTSSEFGFAELPDTHATGSSLMPQKKNPDVLELVRGRSARVTASVTTLLMLQKGLPLAYNRDLQEDKAAFFDAVDTTLAALAVMTDIVRALRFDTAAMRRAASDPALLATDVAEYLVMRGMPFRSAHHLVGGAVRRVDDQSRTLRELTVAEWRELSDLVGDDIVELFDVDTALRRRELPGGPGPRAVSRQLVRAAAQVAKTRSLVAVLSREPSAAATHAAAGPERGAKPGKSRA